MRQTRFFAPTLRQVKADNPGHALLLRGGFVRQLSAGIYSYLPLGWKVLRKIEDIVRQEMDRAGAVELLMPALHPQSLWSETGRDRLDILFRLHDRKEGAYVLGPTHEEVITDLVRGGVSSYRQLPQMLYQIQTKFRDEERPRAGLLRGREFLMKDCYSFDRDLQGLDRAFDAMVEAYCRIFDRCALPYRMVMASGGGIGGFDTREFMVPAQSGEDVMLYCDEDGYSANLELATSVLAPLEDRADGPDTVEEFATPGILTIDALAGFPGGAPAEHQIKTLVFMAGEGDAVQPVLVLMRGDHQLNEAKLQSALHGAPVRPAGDEEIVTLLGAHAGSLGAVGLAERGIKVQVLADLALQHRRRMTTGANRDGFHLRGVDMARDIAVDHWADLRTARAGELSPLGGGVLLESPCIEMGHVFKLGNKYSRAMGATFLDEQGQTAIMEMGCYGIGVSRIMAAVAEIHQDDRGLVWPEALAPFAVHLLLLDKDPELAAVADQLYETLQGAGVDVLYDDRSERPGAKFADSDLFGIPRQVLVGKTTRETGQVELRQRGDRASVTLSPAEVVEKLR